MPGRKQVVQCRQHGPAQQAFVCQHLASGSKGLGFIDSGTGPFPDAWCRACDQVRRAEGGATGDWTERSEAFAGVKLICSECYLVIREANKDG